MTWYESQSCPQESGGGSTIVVCDGLDYGQHLGLTRRSLARWGCCRLWRQRYEECAVKTLSSGRQMYREKPDVRVTEREDGSHGKPTLPPADQRSFSLDELWERVLFEGSRSCFFAINIPSHTPFPTTDNGVCEHLTQVHLLCHWICV